MTANYVNAGSSSESYANDYYEGVSSKNEAYINIKKPGTYIIYGWARFQESTTKGATCYVAIFKDDAIVTSGTAYAYSGAFFSDAHAMTIVTIDSPCKIELMVAKGNHTNTLNMVGTGELMCVKMG